MQSQRKELQADNCVDIKIILPMRRLRTLHWDKHAPG